MRQLGLVHSTRKGLWQFCTTLSVFAVSNFTYPGLPGKVGQPWAALHNAFSVRALRATRPLGRFATLAFSIAGTSLQMHSHMGGAASCRCATPRPVLADQHSSRRLPGRATQSKGAPGATLPHVAFSFQGLNPIFESHWFAGPANGMRRLLKRLQASFAGKFTSFWTRLGVNSENLESLWRARGARPGGSGPA